jgi:hypothetical protein
MVVVMGFWSLLVFGGWFVVGGFSFVSVRFWG